MFTIQHLNFFPPATKSSLYSNYHNFSIMVNEFHSASNTMTSGEKPQYEYSSYHGVIMERIKTWLELQKVPFEYFSMLILNRSIFCHVQHYKSYHNAINSIIYIPFFLFFILYYIFKIFKPRDLWDDMVFNFHLQVRTASPFIKLTSIYSILLLIRRKVCVSKTHIQVSHFSFNFSFDSQIRTISSIKNMHLAARSSYIF